MGVSWVLDLKSGSHWHMTEVLPWLPSWRVLRKSLYSHSLNLSFALVEEHSHPPYSTWGTVLRKTWAKSHYPSGEGWPFNPSFFPQFLPASPALPTTRSLLPSTRQYDMEVFPDIGLHLASRGKYLSINSSTNWKVLCVRLNVNIL